MVARVALLREFTMTRYTSQHYRAPPRMPGWETNGVERELFLGLFRPNYPHSAVPTGGT